MSDIEVIDAVAKKTSESLREIGRRGFILTGPEDAGADLDPKCPTQPAVAQTQSALH